MMGCFVKKDLAQRLPSDCPALFGWISKHIALTGKSAMTLVMKLTKKDSLAPVRIPTVGQFITRMMPTSSELAPCSCDIFLSHERALGMSTASASEVLALKTVKLVSTNS